MFDIPYKKEKKNKMEIKYTASIIPKQNKIDHSTARHHEALELIVLLSLCFLYTFIMMMIMIHERTV